MPGLSAGKRTTLQLLKGAKIHIAVSIISDTKFSLGLLLGGIKR